MRGFRVSGPATADLDEIWDYIAQDKPGAADKFIDKLYDEFLLLASQPHAGLLTEKLRPGLYRFPVGNYLIFYRIAPKHIEIVRVLHGARDIEALFREEDDAH